MHVPKTAGQSIEHVFLGLVGLDWETRAPLLLRSNDRPELGPPRLAHLKANDYVRCKYVSQEMFDDYFKFAVVRNPWSRMVSLYKHLGFDTRCGFNKFVTGEFRRRLFADENWFVGPQSAFVYDDDGSLLVDYVGRFEELAASFSHVCSVLGVPDTPLRIRRKPISKNARMPITDSAHADHLRSEATLR